MGAKNSICHHLRLTQYGALRIQPWWCSVHTFSFVVNSKVWKESLIQTNHQATSHLVFEKCMLSAISSMCIMDFKNSIKTERNEKCFSKVKSLWLKSSVNARSQELYIEFQCRNFSFINSFFLGNLKWADD